MEGRARGISRTGSALKAGLALTLALGMTPAAPVALAEETPGGVTAENTQMRIDESTVATIGDSQYSSLKAAFDAVPTDGTQTKIVLQNDAGLESLQSISSARNIVLDLNGHNVNVAKYIILQGKLTIQDSSQNGSGSITGIEGCSSGLIRVQNTGTLTLYSGTISSVKNYAVQVAGSFVMSGGAVKAPSAMRLQFSSSATITGGAVEATDENGFAIEMSNGEMPGANPHLTVGVSGAYDQPVINGIVDIPNTVEKLNLVGGTIGGVSGAIPAGATLESHFESNISSALPEGYACFQEGDVWVVKQETAQASAAAVDGTPYATLQLAIDDANGKTVTLLRNVEENVVIKSGTNVTIDLAGCKLSSADDLQAGKGTITVEEGATLKVVGNTGTVDATLNGTAALVNYGTVTVEGGAFTRSAEGEGNSYYVVDNQGAMTFVGGNVKNTSRTSSLVRNLGGTLGISGGEFENAGIALKNDEDGVLEITGGKVTSTFSQAVQNWSQATITGGKFHGDVATWSQAEGATGDGNAVAGTTSIGGDAVVYKDVQTYNINNGEAPSVEISGGEVLGVIGKNEGTYDSETEVVTSTASDIKSNSSTIKVSGGSVAQENATALPFILERGMVAKYDEGSKAYAAIDRENLEPGEYIVPDDAYGITSDDLAEGFEATYDEESGKWIVTEAEEPTPPPVVVEPSYDVTVDQPANGTVELSSATAKEGQKVTVTATPDFGYELAQLTVADEDGDALELTENADGTYSFTMPAGDVTVHASFADAWENPFTDVSGEDWFYGAVRTANLLGLMKGYDGTTLFGPDDGLMREQAATVVWNLMGDGDVSRPEAPQADVDQSQWYAPYVNWAVDSKVMDGYSEDDFGVGDSLTREQFAAVVAKAVGADVDSADQAALGAFPDADGVSGWARATMAWAVEAGVLNGVETEDGSRELQSTRELTRAEMAAMMVNAIEVGVLDFGA